MSVRNVNLTVEVHFEKPIYSQYDIIYRIYVNEELMTERTWLWDLKTFLKENICINVNSDTVYTIFLDSILSSPYSPIKLPGFKLQNLQSIDEKIEILNSDSTSMTFRIV